MWVWVGDFGGVGGLVWGGKFPALGAIRVAGFLQLRLCSRELLLGV